jgi:holliday junction DNA helicase RuvA
MIAKICGTVSDKIHDALILELGGLGYELFVATEDWGSARVGEESQYYVYEHIREDAHLLYGFSDLASKRLFELLISISGIGCKVAMSVLSAASRARLEQAIAAGDPELLRGVSGVGKKTAERIIVELKGKIEQVAGMAVMSSGDSVYQALLGLGYAPAQAAEAVAQIPGGTTGEQERIKAALKLLSR